MAPLMGVGRRGNCAAICLTRANHIYNCLPMGLLLQVCGIDRLLDKFTSKVTNGSSTNEV